jgi:hypothetical protein
MFRFVFIVDQVRMIRVPVPTATSRACLPQLNVPSSELFASHPSEAQFNGRISVIEVLGEDVGELAGDAGLDELRYNEVHRKFPRLIQQRFSSQ